MLNIIIIIAVAAFIASRFLSFKLPRDNTPPAQRKDWNSLFGTPKEYQPLKDVTQKAVLKDVTPKPTPDVSQLEGVAKLKALDPSFNEKRFLEGTRTAYAYFCTSWNEQNWPALDNLTGPTLLQNLQSNALDLPATLPTSGLQSVSIEQVRINGRSAVVDVRLTPTQSWFQEEQGQTPTSLCWTLARAIGGDDPNWELQSITWEEKA